MRINRKNAHNESVEKVPLYPTHRNYGGLLPLRQPEIVQYSFHEAYFCLSSHNYFSKAFFYSFNARNKVQLHTSLLFRWCAGKGKVIYMSRRDGPDHYIQPAAFSF